MITKGIKQLIAAALGDMGMTNVLRLEGGYGEAICGKIRRIRNCSA